VYTIAAPMAAELVELDRRSWDELLRRLGVTDAYYAGGYGEAAALLAEGTPAFLHLAAADGDVVFPCLVRADPCDVVTPYGYGGPLCVGGAGAAAGFRAAYGAWCAARGAVSTFVVHHPLFANHEQANALGLRLGELAGTVGWPLQAPDLEARMHGHHRRLVRRARAAGLTAAVEPAPRDLAAFAALYADAMTRMGAAPFYLFPDPYWEALRCGVRLVVVAVRDRHGGLLAAVLGMGDPPWLHYHLGAAAAAGRGTGASHLALLTLAQWGQANGYDALHLGGGVGGRADSLLDYKRRFAPSGGLLPARVGKAVHDAAAYARLTGSAAIDWDGFFPAYRAGA
jgi:serine/alanine adding enzyme